MPANEQITEDYIKLDQFLKLMGAVDTGGQAKLIIQEEEVTVNGQIETRRGRKLVQGDLVKYQGQEIKVELAGDAWK
jgi:ribosome-associated protein